MPNTNRPAPLSRQAQSESLSRLVTADVAVIVAPSGFGKTHLLNSLWSQTPEDRSSVHRVELHGSAADATRLSSLLAEARQRSSPELHIVIDNAEHLADSTAQDFAELLRARSIGRLHIAGRTVPVRTLAGVRAQTPVVTLTANELMLSETDVARCLDDHGVEHDDSDVRRVLALTGGWARGVGSIADWLACHTPHSGDTAIDAAAADVAANELDELTGRLEPANLEFLTVTSILRLLSADVCDVVCETTDSAERLDRLCNTDGVIAAEDRKKLRFSVHPLLRRALRRRLSTVEAASVTARRNGRVASWHESRGEWTAAAEHFLAVSDPCRAADFAAAAWREGAIAAVKQVLEGLDERDVATYVPHVLTRALWHEARGDYTECKELIERLKTSSWNGALPHGYVDLDTAVEDLCAKTDLTFEEGRASRVSAQLPQMTSPVKPSGSTLHIAPTFETYHLRQPERAYAMAREIEVGHRAIGRHTPAAQLATVLALDIMAIIAHDCGMFETAHVHIAHSCELIEEYGLRRVGRNATELHDFAVIVASVGPADERAARLTEFADRVLAPKLKLQALIELARIYDSGGDPRAAEPLEWASEFAAEHGSTPLLDHRLTVLRRSNEALRPERDGATARRVTRGEAAILRLLPGDQTQSEIAERLGVSINTVKSHTRSLYQKLGVGSRSEAIAAGGELGLLASNEPWERFGSAN